MRELGQIPGLVSQRPLGRYARATRGDIPGLWDPRRVNQAWPEPVDNALMAYVPGLGAAGSPVAAAGLGGAAVLLTFAVGGALSTGMLWGVGKATKVPLDLAQSAKLGYGTMAGWTVLALILGGLGAAALPRPGPKPGPGPISRV